MSERGGREGGGLRTFIFASRRRQTISLRDWSSDVCSSDLWPSRTLGIADHVLELCRRVRDGQRDRNPAGPPDPPLRSEERRVGKELRTLGAADACNKYG